VLGDLAVTRTRRIDEVRDQVAAAIRDRGLDVTVAHGLSEFTVDIAVRRPGAARWQVAIVLDGPDWSRRPTVADRDSAPRLLCRSMQWPQLLRFWLPAWIRDRAAFLDEVEEALRRAVETEAERARRAEEAAAAREAEVAARQAVPPEADPSLVASGPSETVDPSSQAERADIDLGEESVGQVPDDRPEPPTVVLATGATTARSPIRDRATALRAAPAIFEPFQPQPYGQQSDLGDLTGAREMSKVREVLDRVIAAEGPIEVGRLARLIARCFGFNQLREARRTELLALLRREQVREHPGIGTYAWPDGLDPDSWRDFRPVRTTTDRNLEECAPEEIANAAAHALTDRPALTRPQLMRATAELLGYGRITQKVDRLVQYGIDLALRSGRIASRGERYHGV
jgi:hypothetical protein